MLRRIGLHLGLEHAGPDLGQRRLEGAFGKLDSLADQRHVGFLLVKADR